MKHLFAMLALIALAGVVPVHAGDIIPYTSPANDGRADCDCNFSLVFQVNAPIAVDALGLFNADGSGHINGPVQVAIFQAAVGGAQVSPTVTFQGDYTPGGLGYDVFQTITPLVLQPGMYLVDESGLNANGDLSGNLNHGSSGPMLNDGGGLLTFVGAAYDFNPTLDNPFASGCESCQPPPAQYMQFDAGTFEFHAAPSVPEPSSLLMLGTGALGLAGVIRRKLIL